MIQPVKEKIILGIDPGTTIMGYGVLRVKGTKPEMIAMGIIDLRKFANHYLKLRHIHERVLSIIESYLPDELAIEAPFFGKNVQSKTSVSEAVTNAIIHGYSEGPGKVFINCRLLIEMHEENENTNCIENTITIEIKDEGVGIENIEKAREPLFTTKPELERSGMGFMFMEMFMDKVDVQSEPGNGTVVTMEKKIKKMKKKV